MEVQSNEVEKAKMEAERGGEDRGEGGRSGGKGVGGRRVPRCFGSGIKVVGVGFTAEEVFAGGS